jgi:hypothetical protein
MDKYILKNIISVNTYILYIETQRPNTNRHVHAHKCFHCAGIELATSCVVGDYSHYYAKSAVEFWLNLVMTSSKNYSTLDSKFFYSSILH